MLQAMPKKPTHLPALLVCWHSQDFSGKKLVNVKPCNLEFDRTTRLSKSPHSKNDQMRQGSEVLIACTGTSARKAIFKWPTKLRESGGLSYDRFGKLVKYKLDELGFHSVEFGLHSLRAGRIFFVRGLATLKFPAHF